MVINEKDVPRNYIQFWCYHGIIISALVCHLGFLESKFLIGQKPQLLVLSVRCVREIRLSLKEKPYAEYASAPVHGLWPKDVVVTLLLRPAVEDTASVPMHSKALIKEAWFSK